MTKRETIKFIVQMIANRNRDCYSPRSYKLHGYVEKTKEKVTFGWLFLLSNIFFVQMGGILKKNVYICNQNNL